MNNPTNNITNGNREEVDPNASDGHLKTVSNLAHGFDRIAVNHDDEKQQSTCHQPAIKHTGETSEDEGKAESGSGVNTSNMINNLVAGSFAAAQGKAFAASAASSGTHGGTNADKARYKQNSEMLESDCDRSQSSISGASWDGNKRGRRSSFRSRVAGKAYSPRWMDQDQHRRMMASSDGYGSLPDDNAVVSFSVIKRKAQALPCASHENNMLHSSHEAHHHNDSASQASQTGSAHDSHDEGYLSQSTAEGYQSGGYHSYHPAYARSDIATGKRTCLFLLFSKQIMRILNSLPILHHPWCDVYPLHRTCTVCSGSVVEDVSVFAFFVAIKSFHGVMDS